MRPPEPDAADHFAAGLGPGVHRAPTALTAASLKEALDTSGLATFVVDLRAAGGKAGILDAFAIGLRFPCWVGRNWDALDDALRDLSWLPSGPRGRALLLLGAQRPGAGSRAELDLLGHVIDSSAAIAAATASPLIVVFAP